MSIIVVIIILTSSARCIRHEQIFLFVFATLAKVVIITATLRFGQEFSHFFVHVFFFFLAIILLLLQCSKALVAFDGARGQCLRIDADPNTTASLAALGLITTNEFCLRISATNGVLLVMTCVKGTQWMNDLF
jgi:hypothetical protein